VLVSGLVCYHCRISPPRFLAECCKKRLNQGSFALLYFRLSTLFDLYLVFVTLFSCTVFVFSFCRPMFIFLYCFVCQYQSSDWLWRLPQKWPIVSGGALNSTHLLTHITPSEKLGWDWEMRKRIQGSGSRVISQKPTRFFFDKTGWKNNKNPHQT